MINELTDLFDDDIATTTSAVEDFDDNDIHTPIAFQIIKTKAGVLQASNEIIDTLYTKDYKNNADTTQRKTLYKADMLAGNSRDKSVFSVVKIYPKELKLKNKQCWVSTTV